MRSKSSSQKGASAVEFALILPLLMLILFGIIEFSLLMYNKAMITNASREGARRGIVYRVDPSNLQLFATDGWSNPNRSDQLSFQPPHNTVRALQHTQPP